jgi:sulfoxide reductase catalytic subunit YedY
MVQWSRLLGSYGQRLRKLHAWNAWIVLALAVTGLILYLPELRGATAGIRVLLKNVHITLGFVSILILVLYIPLIARHTFQLGGKLTQLSNLYFVVALLVGWGVSGLLLTFERSIPAIWSTASLFMHDLLTWVGIPYAIYHSISRSRWVKQGRPKAIESATVSTQGPLVSRGETPSKEGQAPETEETILDRLKKGIIPRRTFLRWGAGLIILLAVGPSFIRWAKGVLDAGRTSRERIAEEDGNEMAPAPTPLPASNPPQGGGAQGEFRVYTVTPIPAFSSVDWEFAIGGLVDRPAQWNWKQFLELPRIVQVSNFHCVTGWSVYQVTWEGIRLSDFLKQAGVQSKAKYVKFYSGDGVYTDTLTIEQAHVEDMMVAVLMDGKPIPQKLGGPVRLVTPQMYAYKSVKWLQAMELIEEEHIGYWEARGYETDAWVNRG